MIPFWGEKTQQNCAAIMISVDRRGTVFPMNVKLQRESFE